MKGFRCVHRVGEVQLKIISQTPPLRKLRELRKPSSQNLSGLYALSAVGQEK
jgi:hypothetical protein